MLGIFVFLMHLPYLPHFLYVGVGFYAFIQNINSFRFYSNNTLVFLILLFVFVTGCIFNMILHSSNHEFELPYTILSFVTFIIAFAFKLKDIKYLVYLIALEAIIGIYELFIGVDTILPFIESKVFTQTNLMYHTRVSGLSMGVNTYAMKLLIGSILLERFKELFARQYYLIKLLLTFAIFLSFSRTVVVTYFVFQIMIYGIFIKNNFEYFLGKLLKLELKAVLAAFLTICVILVLTFYAATKSDEIINQFTRGKGTIELSGRSLIWNDFFHFIKTNLFFGNGSYKMYVSYLGNPSHAHNSFIQIIANNGLFLALFYIIFTFTKINKNSWLYIFPLIIYSLTQYGLFWGISLVDIIFFVFIINSNIFKQYKLLKLNGSTSS